MEILQILFLSCVNREICLPLIEVIFHKPKRTNVSYILKSCLPSVSIFMNTKMLLNQVLFRFHEFTHSQVVLKVKLRQSVFSPLSYQWYMTSSCKEESGEQDSRYRFSAPSSEKVHGHNCFDFSSYQARHFQHLHLRHEIIKVHSPCHQTGYYNLHHEFSDKGFHNTLWTHREEKLKIIQEI